jgi:uncharacterized SAM-binding protein YcdF (DUF218 family)
MMQTPVNRRRRGHWLLWLSLALALFLVYLGITCSAIVRASRAHPSQPADALIVFGAAEYAGRPSPVYRARLDHAYDLFVQNAAPVVITTGGAGADPKFTEGGVGHDYLMRRGIPERALIAETLGTDTAQSVERVAVILRTNGMKSCIAVSDAYHVFRVQKLLERQGLQVYLAPRPGSLPRTRWQRMQAVLREAFSYYAWKLNLT